MSFSNITYLINRISKIYFCLFLLLCFSGASYSDNLARNSGEFMEGGGARPLALGGAYTALTNDIWSVFWNPAGLVETQGMKLGVMHSQRFAGIIYDAVAISIAKSDRSVLAFGLIRLGVNNIPYTRLIDNTGSRIPSSENWIEVSRMASSGDYALLISKAQRYEDWQWGLSPKLVFKHIGSNQGIGLGINVGLKRKQILGFPIEGGLLVRDVLGTPIVWDTGRKEVIVSTIQFGLAADLKINSLDANMVPTFDIAYKLENAGYSDALVIRFGFEYVIKNMISLRVGSNEDRFSFGGGIVLSPVTLDYAFAGHDDLGDTHRISLGAQLK